MELEAIYTVWLREITRFLRARSRLVGSLAQPFLWLAFMGIGLSSSVNLTGGGPNYLDFIIPGVIGMSLLFTSIFSGISVIYDRQFGFLKEILVAPVSRTSIVIGKVLGSATVSLVNAMLVLLAGILIGGISVSSITPASFALIIIYMLLISFSFVSLGLAIASRMTSMEGFQVIMNFLVMPMFFLSGAFFPLDKTPWWMQAVSKLDPLMYGVDGLRAVMLGVSQFPIPLTLGVLLGFSTIMILISAYLFNEVAE